MIKKQKWIQFVTGPIVNENNERVFDFQRTGLGLFLNVKCSTRGDRHKYLRICLIDVLYQLWTKLTPDERRQIKTELDTDAMPGCAALFV